MAYSSLTTALLGLVMFTTAASAQESFSSQSVTQDSLANASTENSFTKALLSTYETNPRLKAAREELKAVDEQVNQALSNFRPTATAQYENGRQRTSFNGAPDTTGDTELRVLTIEQPLFRGGRTLSQYSSAKNQVYAGREALIRTEQQVFIDAITAYMDVVRDQSVLELSRNNESVLAEQLTAARERFEVGEVTRTDVSQSEARKARAESDVITAKGDLEVSRANFLRVIGYEADDILPVPGRLPELPISLEQAVDVGLQNSPELREAEFTFEAADADIWTAGGELLPTVSLRGRATRDDGTGVSGASRFDTDELVVSATIPLYQSGAEYSRVRASKRIAKQREFQVKDARDRVKEAVTETWENLQASISTISAQQQQVRANEIALDGVRQEHRFGARTVLDVLDAEQELFSSRVSLVRAQRDRIVATYDLIGALGLLTAGNLTIPAEYYDPEEHYDDVKFQFIGF